jgi:hypothetical protein
MASEIFSDFLNIKDKGFTTYIKHYTRKLYVPKNFLIQFFEY